MPKYDYDVIVIGGGAAGLTASTFAGQSAAKTLLIEKEQKLGGDCLHYGCVPSKTLIKSAFVNHTINQANAYGLEQHQSAPVDFKKMRARIRSIIDEIQKNDEPEYLADHYNVETMFGSARFVDAHTIEINNRKISSRYFVIGTGSSARTPSLQGISHVPYITNLDIFSLDQLPKTMLVLGAGPIGMEMAQAFQRLGARVTVVQRPAMILHREDKDVSEYVKDVISKEGVKFCLGTQALKVSHDGSLFYLVVEKDNKQTTLTADTFLISTGRKPNVDGMNLRGIGVDYTDRGVVVNDKLQTSLKHIYACGDVNGKLPFTHVASYEAVVAITNAILKVPMKADYTNTPWCTYTDPEVASIGYNETRAKEAGLDVVVHKESLVHNDRALAEGETKGFIKILLHKGRPIGVQIIGYHAGDLMHEWVPVLNKKMKLSVLTNAMHAYPTMAEINKNAAVNYAVSTIPAWSKKLLKIMFGYQGRT